LGSLGERQAPEIRVFGFVEKQAWDATSEPQPEVTWPKSTSSTSGTLVGRLDAA
jgi:hypothetical protein